MLRPWDLQRPHCYCYYYCCWMPSTSSPCSASVGHPFLRPPPVPCAGWVMLRPPLAEACGSRVDWRGSACFDRISRRWRQWPHTPLVQWNSGSRQRRIPEARGVSGCWSFATVGGRHASSYRSLSETGEPGPAATGLGSCAEAGADIDYGHDGAGPDGPGWLLLCWSWEAGADGGTRAMLAVALVRVAQWHREAISAWAWARAWARA